MPLESRLTLLLGRCSRQLRKSCAGANMVHSRAERVFILEHWFTSKLFSAVLEAFSNVYPDKEVPNKTTIHRLVTTFRETGSVCVSSRSWWTSAAKLFFKFFLTNKHKKSLSCYININSVYQCLMIWVTWVWTCCVSCCLYFNKYIHTCI
jgi:hypothetical protein